jgi:hypothetical protein
MLDISTIRNAIPYWMQWLFLLAVVIIFLSFQFSALWLWIPAFIALILIALYGYFRQARRLINGEPLPRRLTGKPLRLDERQVQNDLMAVDTAWALNFWVVLFVWYAEMRGLFPRGWWPLPVLGIGFIIRFSVKALLNRQE